jgi:hypothetical protein
MQGKDTYIRLKVAEPFPGPYVSGSYVHRVASFFNYPQIYYSALNRSDDNPNNSLLVRFFGQLIGKPNHVNTLVQSHHSKKQYCER